MILDRVTEMMLEQWADHRAGEPPDAEEYDVHVEHLARRRNEWERENSAWYLLIGTRLARQAIEEWEKDHE